MFYDYTDPDQFHFRHRWHAAPQGHNHHPFGSFGPGFLGGRGGGFRTGRKLGAAGLQLVLLALLAEKPSHGYEMIKALEERSGGFYSPSPGMIYPALTYLEEIGYATVEAEGTKKRYHITDAGRDYLQQHQAIVETMLHEIARIGQRMDGVRRAFAGEEGTAHFSQEHGAHTPGHAGHSRHWDHAGHAGHEGHSSRDPDAAAELRAAVQALRVALHRRHHSSAEESRRIAEILRRAATDIVGR